MDGPGDIAGQGLNSPPSQYAGLLRQLLQSPSDSLAVLLHLDLRNLGEINRVTSPTEGDRLIQRAEQVLQQWGHGRAITGRIWSNEFVACKAIDHTQAAADEAATLRDLLGELRYDSAIGPVRVGVSLGFSVFRPGSDWSRVLAEAAEACAQAKRRGLNQICRFGGGSGWTDTPTYSPVAVTEFRQLARNNQLGLHAQPIMDLSAGEPRVAKAEFLIRMERNGVHMPLPAGTIEALEHFGLATELDRFSSAFLLDWLDNNPCVLDRVHNLSFNLSARSLVDGRFIESLYRDIKNARLPRGKLCIEITETAAIENLAVAGEVITAFNAIGCAFSLDDFGSGLCSFGYLNSLAVEEVKIDGSFIRDLAHSPVAREIVRAVHQVACATGKKTVAEFVDDSRKLEVLRQIGVHYAQGWLFYPAVAPEKLLELLGCR